jgi:hypothetical protein
MIIMIFWLARTRKSLRDLEKPLPPARPGSKESVATSENVPAKEGLDYNGREDYRISDYSSRNPSTVRKSETNKTLSTVWM